MLEKVYVQARWSLFGGGIASAGGIPRESARANPARSMGLNGRIDTWIGSATATKFLPSNGRGRLIVASHKIICLPTRTFLCFNRTHHEVCSSGWIRSTPLNTTMTDLTRFANFCRSQVHAVSTKYQSAGIAQKEGG